MKGSFIYDADAREVRPAGTGEVAVGFETARMQAMRALTAELSEISAALRKAANDTESQAKQR